MVYRHGILRHLQVFMAVAEDGQFRRAAARLNIAESAVSRRIRNLETELGVGLFERRRDGAFLTPAGKNLHDIGKTILNLSERAAEHARNSAAGIIGTLRVGYIELAVRQPNVAAAIRRFRTEAPQVELNLVPMLSPDMVQQLKAGVIDAGMLHRTADDMKGLVTHSLMEQGLLLALPRRHRLARQTKLRLRDLHEEEMIVPARSQVPLQYDTLMAELRARSVRPRISAEITTSETLVSLVSGGMGVGFIGESKRHKVPRDVILRPVVDFDFRLHADLVWREKNDSPALRRFIDIVKEETAKS
jgi:DNA-binding transcriptional LysR family regulator